MYMQKFWFKVVVCCTYRNVEQVLWTDIESESAIHVLFHLENEESLSTFIAPSAIEAAINFPEVCC